MARPRILERTSFECSGATGEHQMEKKGTTSRGNTLYECRFCQMKMFHPGS